MPHIISPHQPQASSPSSPQLTPVRNHQCSGASFLASLQRDIPVLALNTSCIF